MKHILLPVSALLLAAPAAAQYPLNGFMFNWDRPTPFDAITLITRGTTGAEHNLVRYDSDDYKDWGVNSAGLIEIRGFMVELNDTNDATVEQFGVVGYEENLANLGFPDVAAQRLSILNIPMPPTQNPPGSWIWNLSATFTQPSTFANGRDVFLGVALNTMTVPTPPYDGLWCGTVENNGQTTGVTVWDVPGPRGALGGGIFRENYTVYIINGNPLYVPASATSLSQLAFDWMVGGNTVGGVALAQTNQTTFRPSNAPYAASTLLSGIHPDVNGFNPGRADDIGFAVTTHTSQMPVGSPVFIFLAFGPSPVPNLSITSFPGVDPVNSGGIVCIDFTTAASFIAVTGPGFLSTMSEAQFIMTLTPQARAIVSALGSPFDLWWQGVALDVTSTGAGAEVRTTGCALQKLK